MDMAFTNNLLSAIAAIGTLFTAGTALYLSFRSDQSERKKAFDDWAMERVEIYLSRAYQVLASGPDGQSFPEIPSRLDWLTAARMIEEHKTLISKINLDQNRLKMAAVIDFWRTRFINLMAEFDFDVTYFYPPSTDGNNVMPIEPTSAAVILDFLNWPESKSDPLNSVDKESLNIPRRYAPLMEAIKANSSRGASGIVRGARPPLETPGRN